MFDKISLPLAFLAMTTASAASADSARTIIVMDGSGSMWGQIDGRPKLEIAKQTLADVLTGLPAERELGLLAYGHRRKGDCSDIELLVPPAADQASTIVDAAGRMRFLGKTPLTEAVRQAAIDLRSTENAATVVLITDGLETCQGDPCALGRELEESGIDFTAHVVGFGLGSEDSSALACLASETGGQYFEAGDADGLREALSQSIAAAPEPVAVPPAPEATLDAPDTAGRATPVEVAWTGPARDGDFIDIVPFDGAGTHAFDSAPVTVDTGSASLIMPSELGEYVLRYVQPMTEAERVADGRGVNSRTLAQRPITAVDIDKFIAAPETAGQGATISVEWRAPAGKGDFIGLYHADQSNSDAWLSGASPDGGSPTAIQMPLETGAYELRYLVSGSDGSDVLMAAPVTVIASAATLDAAEAVRPGAEIKVRWSGPAGPKDWIELVDAAPGDEVEPGQGEEHSYAMTRDSMESREAILTAPVEPGNYVIRYVGSYPSSGRASTINQMILGRQPITVSPDAPDADAVNAEADDAADTAAQADAPVPDPAAQEVADPPPAELPPEESGPAGMTDTGHLCQDDGGCLIRDTQAGISFALDAGWATDLPYREGPEAPVRLNFFDTMSDAGLSLNAPPEMTDGMLCLPTRVGMLCNITPQEARAMEHMSTVLSSLAPIE